MKQRLSSVHILSLIFLISCQNSGEFFGKDSSSSFSIAPPSEEVSGGVNSPGNIPNDVSSCEEISSYMLCLSSGCAPVLKTDSGDIVPGQEESLFSKCIPKQPVSEVIIPPKNNEGDEVGSNTGGGSSSSPNPIPSDESSSTPANPISNNGGGSNSNPNPVPSDDNSNTSSDPVANSGGGSSSNPNPGPSEENNNSSSPTTPPVVVSEEDKDKDPKPDKKPIPANCDQVDVKYFSVSKGAKKVLVCHNASGKKHTIEIACSALKAHVDHHEDAIGACKEE